MLRLQKAEEDCTVKGLFPRIRQTLVKLHRSVPGAAPSRWSHGGVIEHAQQLLVFSSLSRKVPQFGRRSGCEVRKAPGAAGRALRAARATQGMARAGAAPGPWEQQPAQSPPVDPAQRAPVVAAACPAPGAGHSRREERAQVATTPFPPAMCMKLLGAPRNPRK